MRCENESVRVVSDMTMRVFAWDEFLVHIGIDPTSATEVAWRKALDRPGLEIAKVLFHTAYSIARKFQAGNYAVSWDEINALNLGTGVSSSLFSGRRNELRDQMSRLGAKLFRRIDDNQYIRTISYYSGAALLKVIQQISETLKNRHVAITDYALQYHNPEEIRADLQRLVMEASDQCLRGRDFPTLDEKDAVLQDILQTLVSLVDLYRECLRNFSEEDLLEVCRLPVPRPAAARIAELFGRVATERIQIAMGRDGQGAFKFPIESPALTSDETKDHVPYDGLWIRITRACNGSEVEEWLTYKREGATWVLDHAGTFLIRDGYVEVPILDVYAISRMLVLGDEKSPHGAMDIRPRVCDGSYILLVEHAGHQTVYLPGRKLSMNDVCHVFSTSSLRIPNVAIRDENGELKEVDGAGISRISLEGEGLEALIIDGDEFPIAASTANDWQNIEERFKYLHQAGCRAYPAGVCPVAFEKLPAAESITYSVGNLNVVLRQKESGHWTSWKRVPPQFLWQRGTLEVRGNVGVLKSAKIIFTDVDFGDFDVPSQVDDKLDPSTISFVNRMGEDTCPNAKYKHGDTSIQFEVEGLTVRRPVDRTGVFFVTPAGKNISVAPESEDERSGTSIALTDIMNLQCKVVTPCDDGCAYSVLLTRGNECVELNRLAQERIRENGYTTFHWRDYAKKFGDQNKESRYFSICIRNEDDGQLWIYKFHGIDPLKVTYRETNGLQRHTVRYALREDGTLSVCHHVAYWDMAGEYKRDGVLTSFVCCPIDRLDDENGFVELPCRSEYHEGKNGAIAQEVVHVPQFKQVIGASLGNGCVCFLTKKQYYSNADGFAHRLISSGFFVRDAMVVVSPVGTDVLSRFRHALSVKDEDEIQLILSSEDEPTRTMVRGVLERVWKNVAHVRALGVRDYLNLYRCIIAGRDGRLVERSGYAFLADWYDFGQNASAAHGEARHLFPEYRRYWPVLMFPTKTVLSPQLGVSATQYAIDYLSSHVLVDQCRTLSKTELPLQLFLSLYDVMDRRYSFETSVDHDFKKFACSRIVGRCYFGQYYEYWYFRKNDYKVNFGRWERDRGRIQASPKSIRFYNQVAPYLFYEGMNLFESNERENCTGNVLIGLRKSEIREYLIDLAIELAEWRKSQSLNDAAQKLKAELLLLEAIDDVLYVYPPGVEKPKDGAPCCFTELVGLLAFRQFVNGDLSDIKQSFRKNC